MNFKPYHINKPAIVILAGGASSRLGRAKQALPFDGSTLLQHTIQVARLSTLGPVCVVLGAHAKTLSSLVSDESVWMVRNDQWESGMASTLQVGLRFMMEKIPETDGVFFLVCDQPFLNKEVLEALWHKQHESGMAMVAASYSGKLGTPALFSKRVFDELLELKGDSGAKKLIGRFPGDVETVSFEAGIFDIDTEEDYQTLLKQMQPDI